MSSLNNVEIQPEIKNPQGKVKVTDLLSRMNEEKKIEKKKKFSSWSCRGFSGNCFWNNINNLA